MQSELASSDATPSVPGRSLRRSRSDPLHPVGSPGSRKYFNQQRKHWQVCTKENRDSLPGSASTSRRRIRKSSPPHGGNSSPARGRRSVGRPNSKARVRQSRITAGEVLGTDGAAFEEAVDSESGVGATPSPMRRKGSAEVATGRSTRDHQRMRSRAATSSAAKGDATDSGSFGHESS